MDEEAEVLAKSKPLIGAQKRQYMRLILWPAGDPRPGWKRILNVIDKMTRNRFCSGFLPGTRVKGHLGHARRDWMALNLAARRSEKEGERQKAMKQQSSGFLAKLNKRSSVM
jgi:hypothetical protein